MRNLAGKLSIETEIPRIHVSDAKCLKTVVEGAVDFNVERSDMALSRSDGWSASGQPGMIRVEDWSRSMEG